MHEQDWCLSKFGSQNTDLGSGEAAADMCILDTLLCAHRCNTPQGRCLHATRRALVITWSMWTRHGGFCNKHIEVGARKVQVSSTRWPGPGSSSAFKRTSAQSGRACCQTCIACVYADRFIVTIHYHDRPLWRRHSLRHPVRQRTPPSRTSAQSSQARCHTMPQSS